MTLFFDSDEAREWVPQILFFTILSLSLIIHNMKTPKLCFQILSSKLKILSFWVMETNIQNQVKHCIICVTNEFWMMDNEN